MARILFFSIPAFGHVHPTLPVVGELTRRGHEVIYYNTEDFRVPIENTGASFRPYPSPPDPNADSMSEELKRRIDNLVGVTVYLLGESARLLPFVLAEVDREAPDLLIFDSIAFWGMHAARLKKIKCAASITTFMLDGAYQLFRWRDFPFLLRASLPFLPAMIRARRRLKRKYGLSGRELAPCLGDLNLLYTSREFHPETSAIDESFHFVGPSFSTQARTSIDFPWHEIDESRQRIYISLGTLYTRNTHFYRAVLDAFADHPAQLILSLGQDLSRAALGPIPANFIVQSRVPQLEILPRTDLFITHGGMNSVSEALSFGVPLITVPQQIEQTMNGRHVAERGAGLVLADRPPFGRGVDAATLRESADRVLRDGRFRERAQKLGQGLQQEGSDRRAADLLESLLGMRPA